MSALGWWSISGDALLTMLRRSHAGELPDIVYAEQYANSDMEVVRETLQRSALRDIAHIAATNPRAYGMASVAAICDRALAGPGGET